MRFKLSLSACNDVAHCAPRAAVSAIDSEVAIRSRVLNVVQNSRAAGTTNAPAARRHGTERALATLVTQYEHCDNVSYFTYTQGISTLPEITAPLRRTILDPRPLQI